MDFLDQDVGDVQVPVLVRLNKRLEPDVFFDGDRFLDHIGREYASFDVITYSLSKSADAPLRRINRLITNLPLLRGSAIKPRETRVIVNNHVKMFLCYKHDALQATYVGSQNLTHGTQINLMYRVDYSHNVAMLDFFNQLWSLAHEDRNRNNPSQGPAVSNRW